MRLIDRILVWSGFVVGIAAICWHIFDYVLSHQGISYLVPESFDSIARVTAISPTLLSAAVLARGQVSIILRLFVIGELIAAAVILVLYLVAFANVNGNGELALLLLLPLSLTNLFAFVVSANIFVISIGRRLWR